MTRRLGVCWFLGLMVGIGGCGSPAPPQAPAVEDGQDAVWERARPTLQQNQVRRKPIRAKVRKPQPRAVHQDAPDDHQPPPPDQEPSPIKD